MAVRVVVEMAFQTSVAIEASSRATPATCGRTVGVRPEKVTTASLASTSAPASSAAACTIAASFFVVGARGDGARRRRPPGRRPGRTSSGARVKVFPSAVTLTGPETATSANSLRTRASSSAVTFGATAVAATSTVRSPGHQRRTASAVPSTSVVVPVTGCLTVTLPPLSEMAPSTGSASSSPRAFSTAAANAVVVDGDHRGLRGPAGEVRPHRGRATARSRPGRRRWRGRRRARPRAFGVVSTVPALDVSTTGWRGLGARAAAVERGRWPRRRPGRRRRPRPRWCRAARGHRARRPPRA